MEPKTRKGPPPEDKARGIFAALVFVGFLILGSYTGSDTVRTVSAVMCVVGLMTTMYFVFKDFEKNDNDEHQGR